MCSKQYQKRHWRVVLLVGLLSGTISTSWADSEPVVLSDDATLMDIYRVAETQHPRLLRQKQLLLAEQKRISQARADFFPQISAEGRFGRTKEDNRTESFPTTEETTQQVNASERRIQLREDSYDDDTITVSGSLALLDLGVISSYRQVKSEAQEAYLEYQETAQTFLSEVLMAYFEVIQAKELLLITEAELVSTQELASLSDSRYGEDLGNRIDLLDALAREKQLQADRLEAQDRVVRTRQTLEQLVGQAINPDRVLAGYDKPTYPSLQTYADWQTTTLKFNPTLLSERQAVESARLDVTSSRSEHLPSLSLDASYTNEKTDLSEVGNGTDNDTTEVALVLDVPIFSGGRVLAQSQERRYRFQAAQYQVDETLRSLHEELQTTFHKAQTDLKRVTILEEAYQVASDAQVLHRRAQEEGLESQIDTLTAERELYTVERSQLNARYDYIYSLIDLQRLSGQLGTDFVASLEDVITLADKSDKVTSK